MRVTITPSLDLVVNSLVLLLLLLPLPLPLLHHHHHTLVVKLNNTLYTLYWSRHT